MYFIKVLGFKFPEAVVFYFVLLAILPSILLGNWTSLLMYYVSIAFIGVWLDIVSRRTLSGKSE